MLDLRGPKTESKDRRVKLKVAESRRRLDVLGPHERIEGLRVSRKGKFKGERSYQVRIGGARSGAGVVLDLLLDWHSGRPI